jgi:acetate kinase
MNILVLNCGSSSLKYKLIAMPSEVELAGGEAQRIGPPTALPSRIVHQVGGRPETVLVPMADHATAFDACLAILARDPALKPDALAHRLVHGGAIFPGHTVVDATVMEGLESVKDLAPLHNPPAIALVRACQARYPALPQTVVFDTAFHATIPEHARTYALPRSVALPLGLRKYGFHGTSHQYATEEAAKMLGRPIESLRAVSCHLGSGGASLCAVVGGKSVDNTMGYTPLQGLLMSTRCGDLDPAVTMRLLARATGDRDAVERTLNRQSGVLGMSGTSADIRDVMTAVDAAAGADILTEADARLSTTAQAYLWRIRKYLGSYLAVVGRADAVIFTDTIGETVPAIRWAVCADMGWMGVEMDAARNAGVTALPADIATDSSPVRILVVQANEELAIARHTWRLLAAATKAA